MLYCDYDSLNHYQPGEFASRYAEKLEGKLELTQKDNNLTKEEVNCVRRPVKSPRPAKLSSHSAQIEQWDRPD